MRATVEPLEGNKVKLSIEVDEAEFDKAVDAAFRKISREVRIPGFRPGKAPRRILEARLGNDVGREQALHDALPGYYDDAVREHDVDVIAAPEIEVTKGQESGDVAFDAVVEIRPQVDVPGYGGLRVSLDRPEPTDDEIDAQVDRLREQFADLVEVDRPARDGDVVNLNLKGEEGGEPVPGLQADDYAYQVGTGSISPELDAQLAGSKVGDALAFDGGLAGTDRRVRFTVLVKGVQERVLPEVTDDWANEVSEFDSVEELRADLAGRIRNVRKIQARLALREKALEALVRLVDDEAPEPLVQHEMRGRLQDLGLRLSAQGMTAEQYLDATGQSQDQLVDELRVGAIQAVKVDLALRAVADAELIEVSDADLEAEIEGLAERMREKPDKVRKQIERNEQLPALRSEIRTRKTLDWLLEQVELVDSEGQPIDRAELELDEADATDEAETDHEHAHEHHAHEHADDFDEADEENE
ncbi:MAG: trigger factor [Acidimicrobiales bacterium]